MFNKNQNSPPILAAVRAMHAAEDRGHDPYNSARVRALTPGMFAEAQRREAAGILACFETQLTMVNS